MLRSYGVAALPRARSISWSQSQHPLRVLRQRHEKIKLARAQFHERAVRRVQLTLGKIELPALETESPSSARLAGARPSATPQYCLDARKQFARIERLCKVVVCAHFETNDPVCLFSHGGQHDDRKLGVVAKPSAEAEPVLARKHQVENDEIELASREPASHFGAVLGG